MERAQDFAGYAHDYADTVGKDHGRIAIRRCWMTGDPALLAHADPDREWCDLASLVWVEAERRCGDRITTAVRIFPQAHRPQLAATGPLPQGRHCQQAAGGGLEQGLSVPAYWPQAQTHLDAIALTTSAAPERLRDSLCYTA